MEKTSEKKTKQEQKTIKNSAKLGYQFAAHVVRVKTASLDANHGLDGYFGGRRDAQDLTLKVGLGQLFAAVAAVNVCVGAQRDAADKDGHGRR